MPRPQVPLARAAPKYGVYASRLPCSILILSLSLKILFQVQPLSSSSQPPRLLFPARASRPVKVSRGPGHALSTKAGFLQ
jgi:hypothetical protein